MGTPKNDLTGQQFNNWKLIEYIGRSKYKAKCLNCGRDKELNQYFLLKGQIPKCTCETGRSEKGLIDLTGQQFGEWKVLEYADDKKWKCQCSCGTVRIVPGGDLRNGKSTSCGHNSNRNIEDLTGKRFGDWLVIEKGPTGKNGETQWLCECQCSMHTRKLVNAYSLKSGASKSCGHDTTGFKDITGQQFGNWKVLNYLGDGLWDCECQCEKHTRKTIDSYALRNGTTKSCGCLTEEIRKQSNLERYGVKYSSQIGTNRTKEQLEAVDSAGNLIKFISNNFKNEKPTTTELGLKLGLDRASTIHFIHKYKLEDYMSIGGLNTSTQERELFKLFPTTFKNDRKILNNREIDLYYPDKNIGIEFNGNYWHSEIKKDVKYHQEKSLLALKKGVRLIHIFEYEWDDKDTKEKLIRMLDNLLNDNCIKVYARECDLVYVNKERTKEFLNQYHLQGSAESDINIGLTYKNELIGIMTFGKPRFNKEYEWEIIRLAYNSDYRVVGGTDKMFKYFISNYNPNSIISYCDISKFNGEVYKKLGFKLDGITNPNYRWVGYDTLKVLKRYQTQKKTLVSLGLGREDQTEEEIMHNLGYLKVYDCGNYRFTWTKDPSINKTSNTKSKRATW